jgi:hypothetical protein
MLETYANSGEAIFIYNNLFKNGQVGVAVRKIELAFGGATAEGIIKIDGEATSEETVFI